MNSGWQVKKLGNLAEVIAGQSPEGKYYNSDGNGLPFYQGKKEFGDKFIGAPTTWTTEITKIAEAGDILMSVRAPVGPINFATDKICIGRGLAAIRATKDLDKDFLFYGLLSKQNEICGRDGAVFAAINKNEIADIDLLCPPLPEQQRIVAVLDEAFAGIAKATENAQKNLANARELFESHLQSIFTNKGDGWVEAKLTDLAESLHQGLNTAGEGIDFYETGYPIIQTRNITDGVVDTDEKMKYMCQADWDKYSEKYNPQIGDVFFTNIGTIGKTAVVTSANNYLIHWNIFKIRPIKSKVLPFFLKYNLDAITSSGFFKSLQKGGTVDFVTKKMMEAALIALPPLSEQQRVVAQLDTLATETKRLEAIYHQKLEHLAALKQSILQKAFAGELQLDRLAA